MKHLIITIGALGLAMASGCNAILGNDDGFAQPDGSQSGTEPDASAAGARGSAGTTGSAGPGGVGGGSAAGGRAGSGGSSSGGSTAGGAGSSVAGSAGAGDAGKTVEGGVDAGCASTCGGACVDLQTSTANCGRCGHDCAALPHLGSTAGVACNAGKCSFPASACVPGWAHCSTNPDDGCETDVTLPANCGGCGTKCPADNPLCTGAACGNACPSGTPTQCGMTCVDLKTDPSHCGTCDKSCTQPASGGNATCANQVCGVACLSGFHLCPGTTVCASDTDAAHCGAQCQSCAGGANGDPACVNGGCSISCHAGYHLCSGACVSNSDATHCGAQCQQCPGDPNGDAACVNSGCGISCHNGFHACGNVCASDTDATHCGTSCATCATGQICSSGSCACAPNTHACPSMAGCYADSVNTCGINCTKCPTVSNGSYSCQSGGVCALACDQGFLQCNGSPRTCATNNWSFESNTAEGFQLLSAGTISDASEGFSVSTARAAQGTHSIAVPATYNCDRRIIEVGVYPCNLSPANLVGKTLRFQVFVDGPAFLDGQRQSGVTILNGQSATINVDLVVGQWQVVSSVLTDPANGSASGFKFSLYMVPTGPPPGNVCMQWSGTIYLDDFSLQ